MKLPNTATEFDTLVLGKYGPDSGLPSVQTRILVLCNVNRGSPAV